MLTFYFVDPPLEENKYFFFFCMLTDHTIKIGNSKNFRQVKNLWNHYSKIINSIKNKTFNFKNYQISMSEYLVMSAGHCLNCIYLRY
jgi:hypothetical protein